MPLTLDRPHDSLLAQFEQGQAIATPYKDDTSLLPQKEVEGRLDKLEAKATNLLNGAINRAGWEYTGRAKKAKEIEKVKSYGANAYGPILYSLWQEGWALGWSDALKEVEMLASGEFSSGSDLTTFAKKKKNEKQRKALAARARFPKQDGARVENSALRAAIEQRTLRVSGDLDEQARSEIQKHLTAAADPKSPISGKELEKRIADSVGKSSARSGAPRDAGSLSKRAKLIASTELMAGYTLAQLSAYRSVGIRYVRWQTYEPPDGLICRVCWSRNGTVHAIDDLIGGGGRAMNRPQVGPDRPGEMGYDPRQYVMPSHPACLVFDTPILSPAIKAGTSREYRGEVVVLETASGKKLTATPNHPIMTDKGWVAIGLIDEGCHVLCGVDAERAVKSISPDNYQGPSLIGEVVASFGEPGSMPAISVEVAAADFHGDGIDGTIASISVAGTALGGYSSVDYKSHETSEHSTSHASRPLKAELYDPETSLQSQREGRITGKFLYPFRKPALDRLAQQKRRAASPYGFDSSPFCVACGSDTSEPGFPSPYLDSPLAAAGLSVEAFPDLPLDTFAAARPLAQDSEHRSQRYSNSSKAAAGGSGSASTGTDNKCFPLPYYTTATGHEGTKKSPESLSEFDDTELDNLNGDLDADLSGLDGALVRDRVISVTRQVDFVGHVYNLETETGWYFADSILTHNCRCRWSPVNNNDSLLRDPGRDPRRRNPFPLRGVWVKAAAGALGIAALYLLLGTTQGLQVTQSAATLRDIAEAGEAARDRLRAAPRSEVSVVAGGLNLNDASARVLQRRFNLTEEQANYLRINLEVNPIADLSELVERVRNGEIPGMTMDVLEDRILSTRPIGGTVSLGPLLDSAALAQSESLVVESLRNVQVPPRVSRAIYDDFIANGPFQSRNDLVERLALRGVIVKKRDRNILDQFIRYTPSTVNLDDVRAAIAQTGQVSQRTGRGAPTGPAVVDSVVGGTVPRDWVAPPAVEAPGARRDPWRVMEGTEAWPFLPNTSTIRARKETQKEVDRKIKSLLAASFPPGYQPSEAVNAVILDVKRAIGAKLEATKSAADDSSRIIGSAVKKANKLGFDVEYRVADSDVRLVPRDSDRTLTAKQQEELNKALDTLRRRVKRRMELQNQIYDQVLDATRLENELRLLIVNEGGRLDPNAPFAFTDELIEFSLPFRSFVEGQAKYRRRWKMRREEKPFMRRLKRRWK